MPACLRISLQRSGSAQRKRSPAACSEYYKHWQQQGPGTEAAEPSGSSTSWWEQAGAATAADEAADDLQALGFSSSSPNGEQDALEGFAQPSASHELDPALLAERPLCGQFQSSGQCARGQRCPLVHGLLCQVGSLKRFKSVCANADALTCLSMWGGGCPLALKGFKDTSGNAVLDLHGKAASRCR